MIAVVSQTIASFMWIALAIIGFVSLHKWNERFSDLYNKLKTEFNEDDVRI